MSDIYVSLKGIDEAQDMVTKINRFKTDIDLVMGSLVIDAKSLVGVCSIDLSKKITLRIHNDEEIQDIKNSINKYIV